MNLNEKEIKNIKALHVITKMPICIFDSRFNCIKNYCSDKKVIFSYDFSFIDISSIGVWYCYGVFNEVFISLPYKDVIITMGPFLTNHISNTKKRETFTGVYD